MKGLALSIYTGLDGENKVTMTASFDTHEEAVKFHTGIAALCKDNSLPVPAASARPWIRRIGNE